MNKIMNFEDARWRLMTRVQNFYAREICMGNTRVRTRYERHELLF